MKPAFNSKSRPPVRYSTGPLYSRKELTQTLAALARNGYQKVEENSVLGMAIFHRDETGKKRSEVCIYLDHLGCDPLNSGIMLISGPNGVDTSTVWTYAKEHRGPNPVMKLLRKMF